MRWLPLAALLIAATMFEPLRAAFEIELQGCEVVGEQFQIVAAFTNLRHLIGYGVIAFVAVLTVPPRHALRAVLDVLLFSGLLELQQSALTTGHCRSWDMIPNILAVTAGLLAAHAYRTFRASWA